MLHLRENRDPRQRHSPPEGSASPGSPGRRSRRPNAISPSESSLRGPATSTPSCRQPAHRRSREPKRCDLNAMPFSTTTLKSGDGSGGGPVGATVAARDQPPAATRREQHQPSKPHKAVVQPGSPIPPRRPQRRAGCGRGRIRRGGRLRPVPKSRHCVAACPARLPRAESQKP